MIQKGVLNAVTPSGKKNPFACSLFIYNLGKNDNLEELKTMIPEFKHMYYPEYDLKNRGKGIFLHFYSIEYAKMCMKKIKSSPNPYTSIKFI